MNESRSNRSKSSRSAQRSSRTAAHSRSRLRPPARRRWWPWLLAAVVSIALTAMAAVTVAGTAPRLLSIYVQQRAAGHNALIERSGDAIAALLMRLDRGEQMPRLYFPPWAMAAVSRDDAAGASQPGSARRTVAVFDAVTLVEAVRTAEPGDVIVLAPGTYRVTESLAPNVPGRPDAPIVVRAERLGEALIESTALETFYVHAPHWTFENLTVTGVCERHDDCEHAFHIVGAATDIVIRNNDLHEFNAAIKVNGEQDRFPDRGVVEYNRMYNVAARDTEKPVTVFDLLGANDWRIEHNLIADFVKMHSDRVSYGAFAKGGARNTLFANNVVLCEHRLRGAPGRRIGLSFGGGGSGEQFCRDGRCITEHSAGTLRGNIVASCSDEGIYLNQAAQTRVEHNTLLDTAGLSARYAVTSAALSGNIIDGAVRVRDGALLTTTDDDVDALFALYLGWHTVHGYFQAPEMLDLNWQEQPTQRVVAVMPADLCGAERPHVATLGAFEDIARCVSKRAE